MAARAAAVEIFSSLQGEGRHVGEAMVFLRLATCPLRCTYCDTTESYVAPKSLRVERGGTDREAPNPLGVTGALQLLEESAAASRFGRPRWLSLTGGEPLVYPDFCAELGAAFAAGGGRVLLETAACDAAALASCIDAIDHLSADAKLPGTLHGGGEEEVLREAAACVALAREAGKTIDLKLVLTPRVDPGGLAELLAPFAGEGGDLRVFLQPVTPCLDEPSACPPDLLAAAVRSVRATGLPVRVLGQTHKVLKLR